MTIIGHDNELHTGATSTSHPTLLLCFCLTCVAIKLNRYYRSGVLFEIIRDIHCWWVEGGTIITGTFDSCTTYVLVLPKKNRPIALIPRQPMTTMSTCSSRTFFMMTSPGSVPSSVTILQCFWTEQKIKNHDLGKYDFVLHWNHAPRYFNHFGVK